MNGLPLATRPSVVLAAVIYLLVVAAIGLWAARRTRDERDFFIAGQRIGLWVTGLATMSAAFSGFVFVGGPGLTYRLGIGSLWIVAPVGFTAGLLCWVLARRLRALAGIRQVFTVPDVVGARFESPAATGLSAVAITAGSIAYLATQLLALGVLLRAIFGLESLALAMGLGLAVLLFYSVVGGMVAGVYTDVVQGALMLVAAGAVFLQAVAAGGGWAELTASIADSELFGSEFLDPLGRVPVTTAFGFFFIFGVGVLGQPHMLHKFFMLDDPRKLRWMPLVLGGSQTLCLLTWIGIGLAVPALVAQGLEPALTNPDAAAPTFLLRHCSPVLAGLVFAGVMAAIMSTADSFLNIGAAAVVRDLPRALGRPLQRELGWARVAVVGFGVLGGLLALAWSDLVALVGTFAFGAFAAALAPTLALGLSWERVTAGAAAASIAAGLVLAPLLELLRRVSWLPDPLAPGVPPSAVALAASFAVLLGVSLVTRSKGPIAPDVQRAMHG